jgi:hypothetical protein
MNDEIDKEEIDFDIDDLSDIDKILDDSDGSKKKKKPAVKKIVKKDPISGKPIKENYVDGKEFTEEILKFYESGVITDVLGTMIYKIANGLSHRPNFINYSYREEFVSDAMVNMIKALNGKKFDPKKGFNPFSYFTCIAFHTFCTRIKKEKKHQETVESYQQEYYPETFNNGSNTSKNSDESN